jgi:hypothetical protein
MSLCDWSSDVCSSDLHGKVHPCTSTEALCRPYCKVHPCTGRTVKCTLVHALRLCTGPTVKCTLVQELRLCAGRMVKCTLVQALRLCTGRTVKCTLVQELRLCAVHTARRRSTVIALFFLDHGTRRFEASASRPGRSLLPGKIRYPLYRRLGGPQGLSGQMRKISPPPGFDPRTVQPVASHYTDYATRP